MSPPKSAFSFKGGSDPDCASKNRYPDHLPPDMARLHLTPMAGRPANYTYINAYFVDVQYLCSGCMELRGHLFRFRDTDAGVSTWPLKVLLNQQCLISGG
eukprot:m.275787 g.275787  ORF g.275787 m.275787 type:complete len:100 (+) comp40604_c0_seq9:8002-8301(+)